MAGRAGEERAGRYVTVLGHRAFSPRPLPPDPPVQYDEELIALLSEADQSIARLDATTELLPNPDLFVRMYIRKEAARSAQIEGTQASMMDLLEFEANPERTGENDDVREIANYVRAMNYGLTRLAEMPISSRLLRDIHDELLTGVRGQQHRCEFRRHQVHIGPVGRPIEEASFVPPPANEVPDHMAELENFLHGDRPMPTLVWAALSHAQFETIHPFGDGNGRLGRLLITFLLCARGVLQRPTLYLSHFFQQHRQEYYDRLQAVHDRGDFEGWVRFFLRGVREVSQEGVSTARGIQTMRAQHQALIQEHFPKSTTAPALLDHLFEEPVINVERAQQAINRSQPVAGQLVNDFERLGLLRETTGQTRNRLFRYQPYLDLFGEVAP